MKLGIMQPYFFPYIGYFSLIKQTDKFILLDAVQFIRHGWIERNRILNPSGGWQYIQVPLKKHSRETKIWEIAINNEQTWREKIIAQLQHYRKMAPYFSRVIAMLKNVFSQEYASIVSLNKATLKSVCGYLEIKTPIEVYSEMELAIAPVNTPDEWALNICKAIDGVTEYRNPPGCMDLFDRSKYESNQIELKFLSVNSIIYDQKRPVFEPNLSIIDIMMFNSPEQINKLLDDYELLT
jgi:hypothetical protein